MSGSRDREPDGTLRPIVNPGDWVGWLPITIASQGSSLVTDSLFLNDKWDLGSHGSFNLGVRYDRNDGKDRAGNQLSNDSHVSPRLGAIYDVRGDGRFRANASYSQYVSKLWETMGFMTGSGVQPWWIYYEYRGPSVGGAGSGLDSFDVLEKVFEWFLANGGTGAAELIFYAAVPGVSTSVPKLDSPNVAEWTIGFGAQLGSNGVPRIDYVDREWGDFYVISTTPGDTITGVPGTLDVQTFGNCDNCVERTYTGASIQASYRFTDRFNLGGNYTWSETKGNSIGENRGSGPLAETEFSYVEYIAFEQNNPIGLLPTDSTHKVRLWATYDVPLGSFGNLNFSALQRFDSGTPYGAFAVIDDIEFRRVLDMLLHGA